MCSAEPPSYRPTRLGCRPGACGWVAIGWVGGLQLGGWVGDMRCDCVCGRDWGCVGAYMGGCPEDASPPFPHTMPWTNSIAIKASNPPGSAVAPAFSR